MKILLFGKHGQLGWQLQHLLPLTGQTVMCDRNTGDLEDPQKIRNIIQAHKPDIIVNAAAYTAVDKAESEPNRAKLVNSTSVQAMAEETKQLNSWLIHYSTDYVFDGKQSLPHRESDQTNPLSEYGRTKLAGEQAILESGCKHLIFRTSWLYSIYGSNFPLTILRRAMTQDQLQVVSDAIGTPTSAEMVASITNSILYRMKCNPAWAAGISGIYHLTASGATSWYHYAEFLISEANKKGFKLKASSNRVFPIPSSSYNSAAIRPQNSCLDTQKLCRTFDIATPHWKFHVERLLEGLIRSSFFHS